MITIDTREQRSMVPGYIGKLTNKIVFKALAVGDYVLDNRVEEDNKVKFELCAERKDMRDYISSMVSPDHRLNNQLYQMSTNYAISLLLVEGGSITEALMYRKMKRQQYWSSFAGSLLRRSPDGIGGLVVPVPIETPFDTALFLVSLHDKLTDKDGLVRLPKIEKIKVKDEERALSFLMGFPNVGEKRAEILLHHYGSLRKVFMADYRNITAIKGIPKNVVTKIWDVMNKEVKKK